MATIKQVRVALAAAAKVALDVPRGLSAWQPPIQPDSVYIIPSTGADYMSFEDGSQCKPAFSFSALVLAPLTDSPARASEWLDERAQVAANIAAADRSLGGLCSGVIVASIDPPGLVQVDQQSPALALEIRFRPLFVSSS